MKSLVGLGVSGAVAVAMTLFVGVPDAQADGMQCGRKEGNTCTKTIGQGLYVNQVKVSTALPCRRGVVYHFEVVAPGWSTSTPDKTYECNPLPSGVDSGWISIEKNFPDRALICGRAWFKEGAKYVRNGQQCVTLRAG